DGDGDLDTLATGGGDILWYANDGAGGFGAAQTVSLDPANFVATADVDGDGDLDVLSAIFSSDTIAWYENTDGQGSFGPQQAIGTTADSASSVFAADLDHDGDLDVLATSAADDTIAWYENTDGQGTFGPEQVLTTTADGASLVIAADVDRDGDLDVLACSANDDTVAWYENTDGLGSFGPEQVIDATADNVKAVVAADLDGDGDLDALSASFNDDTIAWYENTDGQGGFGPAQALTTTADGAFSVRAVDVDQDGDLDVVAGSTNDDSVAWYENTDGQGSFGSALALTTAADGVRSVFATDLDGDGDVDVLSASYNGQTIAWYENETIHRTGSFGHAQSIFRGGAANAAWSVFPADIDGDGDLDALAGYGNTFRWYENADGFGSFTGAGTQTSYAIRSVFGTDVDGDGDVDALVTTFYATTWYENSDGLGTFVAHAVSSDGGDAIVGADVDGDGDADAVVAFDYDDTIAWFENTDGAGTFGAMQVVTTTAMGARSVFAADLDGDGDLDLLTAS
ncbi:MAG TPA: VCBS repeat-containing protein, partial [Candidatus Polarisedimenticolia bacterium]|nr:VCBS repeat-containing protein [Candidatus Polarisedimenticolia bacterium]